MIEQSDLGPLLDAQQNQLGLLFGDSDSIDTKALAILGINVALLLFVVSAAVGSVHHHWLHMTVVVTYLVSLGLDAFAVWPRGYIGAAVKLETHPEYLTMESDQLILQLLSDTDLAITTNAGVNAARWRYCLSSFVVSLIGLILTFAIL